MIVSQSSTMGSIVIVSRVNNAALSHHHRLGSETSGNGASVGFAGSMRRRRPARREGEEATNHIDGFAMR